jgi:hypothetical protein
MPATVKPAGMRSTRTGCRGDGAARSRQVVSAFRPGSAMRTSTFAVAVLPPARADGRALMSRVSGLSASRSPEAVGTDCGSSKAAWIIVRGQILLHALRRKATPPLPEMSLRESAKYELMVVTAALLYLIPRLLRLCQSTNQLPGLSTMAAIRNRQCLSLSEMPMYRPPPLPTRVSAPSWLWVTSRGHS